MYARPTRFPHAIRSIGTLLLLSMGLASVVAGQALGPTSAPSVGAAATPGRSPQELAVFDQLEPEVAAAVRRLNAGDRSLAPTVLLWLGSEQDGLRLGKGTGRVRLAIRGASRLQIKEAVPWLITIYDNPTADPVIRDLAAAAAIRIDPYYSVEFLREVLDDATLRSLEPSETLVTCRRDAAVALATIGDETARSMLVDAMIGYLDSLNRGGPLQGPRAQNWRVCLAMSRSSDPDLADRLAQLRPHYPKAPALAFLNGMIQQIRINQQPVEELLRHLRGVEPTTTFRRVQVVLALGTKGGADVVPDLDRILREAEARQGLATTRPAAASQPAPATRPAVTGDVIPSTGTADAPPPATRGSTTRPSPADDVALADACREAIAAIRLRTTAPAPDEPAPPAATQPFSLPGEETVPADAELRWFEHLGTRQVHNTKVPVATFYDPEGMLPPVDAVVKDEALFRRIDHLPYGLLGRIRLDDGGAELRAVRLQHVAPGELAPDVYVLEGRHTVHDGKWEHAAAVLRKFGKQTTALIPNRRRADGQLRPDTRMSRVLESLVTGQSVEATFEPGEGPVILRTLATYRPPLAARIVAFPDVQPGGAARPAVELEIARKRKTYVLAADDTPYATLSADEIRALPVTGDVKVIVDDAADPPALLSVRFEGAVASRADGSLIGARARCVDFVARRDRDFGGSFQVIGHEQFKATCLRSGVGRLLQDAAATGRLAADKVEALKRLQQRMAQIFDPADTNELTRLASRWAAADGADRAGVEREILLRLTAMDSRLTSKSQAEERELRSILSAAQFKQALLSGGWHAPEFRPPATTRPATRPAG